MGKKRKSAQDVSSKAAKRSRPSSGQEAARVTTVAPSSQAIGNNDEPSSSTGERRLAHTQISTVPNSSGAQSSTTNAMFSPGSLIPPFADDSSLRKSHDVHVLAIVASSKIETKVRQALSLLKEITRQSGSKSSDKDLNKTVPKKILVALVARAPAANKCVSVVEIVKREFAKEKGVQLFQYTAVWAQLENCSPKGVKNDPATESKEAESPDKPRLRNTSCLAVYLTCQSIPKLKEVYTEHICGLQVG